MNTPSPTFIRTDLGVPVFTFQTESDVAGGVTARQNDSDVSPNLFRQGGRGNVALRHLRFVDRPERHR